MSEDQFLQIFPKIKTVSSKKDKGVFVIEPFYPGYGMTIGNSLRRVLLSSLEGSAITGVKIKGVSHEFSALPHVKEDIVEIILNLKAICIKSLSQKTVTLSLKAKGKKKIKAGDIQKSQDIEIINPDLHIATLDNSKAEISIEMRVEKGRGYVPIEERGDEKLPTGMIAVDAIFTPIKRVLYSVEHTRVGRMTNLEKLNLEIITDGTIDPKDALQQASNILVEHFSLFTPDGEEKKKVTKKPSEKIIQITKANNFFVEEVDFSPRAANALLNNDIKKMEEITKLTEDELGHLKGFGNVALQEVKEKLKELGLELKEAKKTKSK